MSDPEPEIDVPLDVRIGVWANDIRVLADVEHITLDFCGSLHMIRTPSSSLE